MLKLELLDTSHDRGGFDCGVEALNRYLQQIARQHISKGVSKTYVLAEEDATAPKPVLGFFTISLCQVFSRDVPEKWARKLPEQIPAMKLGRLAVAKPRHGAGIGTALLVEALQKVASVAALAGGIGLFVDAKDENAASFYARFGFERIEPLTLFMPMQMIVRFAQE